MNPSLAITAANLLTTLLGTPIPHASTSLTIAQGFGGHIAIARLRGT